MTELLVVLSLIVVGILVVPNEGEYVAIRAWLGQANAAPPWTLRLFSNNITPGGGSVMANFTEVAGGGYAAFALTTGSWVVTAGSPTQAVHPAHTFVFTGATDAPGTVYGYYITDANGKVMGAEKLAGPFTPSTADDSFQVTPTITAGSVSGD